MTRYEKLTLEEVALRIKPCLNTLILFHRHPDGDAVGSGFALKLLLEEMGCKVYCSCDDPLPERLSFLVPNPEVSIKYDALPCDFIPEQIIAVDTASPAQVGQQYDIYQGRIHLMIDHHEKGEMYADGCIMGGAAATGEMIYELSRMLLKSGKISVIPQDVDKLLYAAISSDTGCFRYSNVSADTHRIASELLKGAHTSKDFDPSEINHLLFEVKSEKLLLAEKLGFDRLQLFEGGRIGMATFPVALKKAHGISDEHLETLVDVPRSLVGVEVAVAIRQTDEDTYRVSMRSNGRADVSVMCATLGGGGHVKAAGCTVVTSLGMQDAVEQVRDVILSHLD